MARYVTVRYVVPVYATVDLDAEPEADGWYADGAVVQVKQGDSDILRLDLLTQATGLLDGDPFAESYIGDGDVHPADLSPEDREKALDIAENTAWPSWEGY